MDALVLAAGDGTRLLPLTKDRPKVMIKIFGIPILERVLHVLKNVGVKKVVIVIGHKGEKIKEYFGNKWNGMEIIYKKSGWVHDGILKSVIVAKDAIKDRFILLCGDTIPEEKLLLKGMEKDGTLVVSVRNPSKDDSVVAKVGKDGIITEIGMKKNLKDYNVSSPGITICDPIFFKGVSECIAKNKIDRPDVIEWFIKNNYKVNSFDISDNVLIEIDTKQDLIKAKKIILKNVIEKRLKKHDINLFKKLFNLPISIQITKLFSYTNLTPNQITILSMICAIISGILLGTNNFIMGGILCYLSAMLDATDGKISQLKFKDSKYGAYLDSITDRVAEFSIVLGLTYGLYHLLRNPLVFLMGFLAVFGWLGRFYVKELFFEFYGKKEENIKEWKKVRKSPYNLFGDRDVNFFIIMITCILGYPLIGMIYTTISSNAFLIIRFIQTIRRLNINP